MDEKHINIQIILKGCMESNPNSQGRLYKYFYGYGMNVALRFSKTNIEAEEILNDSFLKVFKNLNQYDTSFPFKTWFRKIIVNTAIDYFRKQKRYNEMFSSNEADVDHYMEDLEVDEIDQDEDVLELIQQLPPGYQLVFNLYVMENYKHHEIAKKLGISIGTSKSNLSRAKAKLKILWLEKNKNSGKIKGHG